MKKNAAALSRPTRSVIACAIWLADSAPDAGSSIRNWTAGSPRSGGSAAGAIALAGKASRVGNAIKPKRHKVRPPITRPTSISNTSDCDSFVMRNAI
jgi:hypothetical protein